MSILLLLSLPAEAADVLQQVPRDALGFVIARNLSQVDAHIAKLLGNVQVAYPGRLALLRSVTGIGDGLEPSGDLLLVLLPSVGESRQFDLAVWLPIKDYDALVRSLNGDPGRQVAAVTVAGEDLIAVRHGDWAVLADPDQRDRLEQLGATVAPPRGPIVDWTPWIESNDVTLVILNPGMRHAWKWALRGPVTNQAPAGAAQNNAPQPNTPPGDAWSTGRQSLQTVVGSFLNYARWLRQTRAAAFGIRLDDASNAVAGARVALPDDFEQLQSDFAAPPSVVTPPTIYGGGDFIVNGRGTTGPIWTASAVQPYVLSVVRDLKNEFGIEVEGTDVLEFQKPIGYAVFGIEAFATLTRPGEKEDGVFTNSFLALRVKSSSEFLGHAKQAMSAWNKMLTNAKGGEKLVFEEKATQIGGHDGIEYSIDMVGAFGDPGLPEMQQSTERLFGEGGRFRVQYIEVDLQTVLLAVGTKQQVEKLLPVMAEPDRPNPFDTEELRAVTEMLPQDADWRIYFSPRGYFAWMKRQMDAIAPDVIGGPLVREFPDSPPMAAAGGVDGNFIWADVVVPADTMRRAGEYVRK